MPDFSQFNFKGKKALIRVDYNVPLNDKLEITDDTRMRASIPTIQKILKDRRKRYSDVPSRSPERRSDR